MFTLKYYKIIEDAQRGTTEAKLRPDTSFDIDDLATKGIRARVTSWLIKSPFLYWIFREFWPNPQFGRLVVVTREADVREVLNDSEIFEVPYGLEMTELAGGTNFVLGMEGNEHSEQRNVIRDVLKQADIKGIVDHTGHLAKTLIEASAGRIDVVSDLIARTATETCASYFGLDIEDHKAFADWTLAMSALLFADPFGRDETRQLALYGAQGVRDAVLRAIHRARQTAKGDTLVDRLVQYHDGRLADGEIAAILIGLAVGFIPTTVLAAGKILQELLRRPEAMRDAMDKAGHDDRKGLEAVLFEAARLNPALAPGQWRYARASGAIARGTLRAKKVPAGSVLMVATMSALRDRRAFRSPGQFRPDREPVPAELIFGTGSHWCLGKYLAMAQISEIFMVLLRQKNLRASRGRTGRLTWLGPFPRRLNMEFDPALAAATQSMITIAAPVRPGIGKKQLEELIAALGNPAHDKIARTLDATGIVHFASLSVIDVGEADRPSLRLLLELNADGTQEAAIQAFAEKVHGWLAPVFAHVDPDAPLADVLKKHVVELHTRPWGAIGLTFSGTDEFSVADIEKQAGLASFARDALENYLEDHIGLGSRAMLALDYVRKIIRQDSVFFESIRNLKRAKLNDKAARLKELLERGENFRDFLIRPDRQRLQFSAWTESANHKPWWQVVITAGVRRTGIAVLGLYLVLTALIYFAVGYSVPSSLAGHVLLLLAGPVALVSLGLAIAIAVVLFSNADVALLSVGMGIYVIVVAAIYFAVGQSAPVNFVSQILLAASVALVSMGLGGTLILALFMMVLRYYESQDVPDDRNPDLEKMRAIARSENHPGYAQNHFMSVTTLKKGWFRKLTLALSLWNIEQLVTYWFRPGFISDMGTIHYAKWFRLPGTDKLIFQSNYDGSWESYLEDFIMKAHPGQSAVWSHGVGFPQTRFLVYGGAQDGDRFKRWTRRQQVLSGFWYSRFPDLTTDQIRNNALIHDGLMHAATDTDAREWLRLFGSMQRPDYAIETSEVQSLIFHGFGRLKDSICAIARLPESAEDRAKWLAELAPGMRRTDVKETPELAVTFGERLGGRDLRTATFVAFSAAGLTKLGLSDKEEGRGLDAFPAAFNIGMANRAHVLGDQGESCPQKWLWSDIAMPQAESAVRDAADAVLLVYGESIEDCSAVLQAHAEILGGPKHAFLRVVETQARDFEHFGFRDGISQPIIRGTQRFTQNSLPRDVVEPGEFILGYRNNQDYFPPSLVVGAGSDMANVLPTAAADSPGSFPNFKSKEGSSREHDFGRNGSFLVVRQFNQDVDGFHAFAKEQAKAIEDNYAGVERAAGGPITAKWIEAKMVGRWHDGTPLIDRPWPATGGAGNPATTRDNDFAYGIDDPVGLRCPLGAHIRRANPRDSLHPGEAMQQEITNRHRLLRRGRSYEIAASAGSKPEKGLMFVCFCADIDRQFEFIQQTWVSSALFHGLIDEPDPVVGQSDPSSKRIFTIPTVSGAITLKGVPNFVSVRGGGYFFLPSRSAIQYLYGLNRAVALRSVESDSATAKERELSVDVSAPA